MRNIIRLSVPLSMLGILVFSPHVLASRGGSAFHTEHRIMENLCEQEITRAIAGERDLGRIVSERPNGFLTSFIHRHNGEEREISLLVNCNVSLSSGGVLQAVLTRQYISLIPETGR